MNHRRLAAAVLLIFLPFAFADEPKPAGPKSPEAQAAIANLEAAKRKAADEYQAALSGAAVQAVQELEVARRAATKAGNAAEADAITAAIDQAKAGATAPTKPPVGDWQVTYGNTVRDYRFGADGTVSILENGKPTPIDRLTWKGNAWTFNEPKVVRMRKLYLTDDGYLLIMNYSLRTGEAEGCGCGQPIK